MPAPVVVVHNDVEFRAKTTAAFREAAIEVEAFAGPLLALTAEERAQRAKILITRIDFPAGQPNGVSLALVMRSKNPVLKVIFATRQVFSHLALGIGEVLQGPVELPPLNRTRGWLRLALDELTR